MSTVTAICDLWTDDFQFDTDGVEGWLILKQGSDDFQVNGVDVTTFTTNDNTYYGPMSGDDSGAGRHLVESLFHFYTMHDIIRELRC